MAAIWKYPLASKWLEDAGVHMVRPVHVGHDPQGNASIWVEVDPDGPPTRCKVSIVGTGEPIPEDAGQHAGSFVEGPFVWHIFMAITPAAEATA